MKLTNHTILIKGGTSGIGLALGKGLLDHSRRSFIITTTSGLSAFPKPDGLIYSATKAAMRNFTIGLHYSLKGKNIRIMEFIPPVTETAMTEDRDKLKMTPQEFVSRNLPQLAKERRILTVRKMRLFFWIAFLLPGLAHKILSKS